MTSPDEPTNTPTSVKAPRRRASWWLWHQRLGLSFAVVFVVVVLTGIALNHTGGLRLDERYITSDWLLDWYGMAPEGEPVAYVAEGWAVTWDGNLYWQGQHVASDLAGDLIGLVEMGLHRVALIGEELLLFTTEGQVIERLSTPGPVTGLASNQTGIYLATPEGIQLSTDELLSWSLANPAAVLMWSQPATLPDTEREAVLVAYRGQGLSWYRVLLDLHSGRFFGSLGVWIVDLAALAMLFLTVTGVYYALCVKRGR